MSLRVRPAPLVLAVLALAAIAVWRLTPRPGDSATGAARLDAGEVLAALAGATAWVNGPAVDAAALRGEVVVVLLWSDTEPLGLAALAEAEAWRRAYGPLGARVVGVHVPEYAFSADTAVTAAALRRQGARFPVALDGGYRISSRLEAQGSLPVTVVVGAYGRAAHVQVGQDFARVHHALREALRRARPEAALAPDPEAAAPAHRPVLRRVPFGTSRVTGGPLAGVPPGQTLTFTAEFRYQVEGEPLTPYPVGRWRADADGVTAARGGASEFIAVRSTGGEVAIVAGPPPEGPGRVWILDGDEWLAPGEAGEDVHQDARGATWIDVDAPRLYHVATGDRPRRLKLSPERPGTTFYEASFLSR